MKKLIIALILGIGVMYEVEARNIVVSDELVTAIMKVESDLNASAIGDGGKAIGCGQIHKVCIDDVNRILKERKSKIRYSYEDRKSPTKSKEIMKIYLSYYGAHYEHTTGKKVDSYILSRIWNGGPNGWKKVATLAYARKVHKYIA